MTFDMTKPIEHNDEVLNNLNQNKMKERIPFDLEKWQSGEYDVEYNNGNKPLAVYHIKEANVWQIVSVNGNNVPFFHFSSGHFLSDKKNCYLDLFLTPKKKKGWVVVYCSSRGQVYSNAYIISNNEEISKNKEYNKSAGSIVIHESEFEY